MRKFINGLSDTLIVIGVVLLGFLVSAIPIVLAVYLIRTFL